MAKVIDPSGTGLLPGGAVIDENGNAYLHQRPRDTRTPKQLRYRQLMRALNRVLALFGDETDLDVETAVNTPTWWSSELFARWAANHGTAIEEDLNRYQFDDNFQNLTLVDTFNRANAPNLGPDWTALYNSAQIIDNRCYTPANTITVSMYNTQTFEREARSSFTIIKDPDTNSWPFAIRHGFIVSQSDISGYVIDVQFIANPPQVALAIARLDSGTLTHLNLADWHDISAADSISIGLEHAGESLAAWISINSDENWTLETTAIDETYPDPGRAVLTCIPTTTTPAIVDDFAAAGDDDTPRERWNTAAGAMGIADLQAPVDPFNYGEAGELLFLVCARLWRMHADPGLPDPVGSDPNNWITYLTTGTYPA